MEEVCESWEQIDHNSELLDKRLEKMKLEKRTESTNTTTTTGFNGVPPTGTDIGPPTTVMKILTRKDNQDLISSSSGNVTTNTRLNSNPIFNSTPSISSSSNSTSEIVLDSTNPDSLRTQYVPPQPQLKILSRPKASSGSKSHLTGSHHGHRAQGGEGVKGHGKKQNKSLQQREQEYAEARMRILGDVRFVQEEKEAELEALLSPAEILKLKVSEAMQGEPGASTVIVPKSSSSQPALSVIDSSSTSDGPTSSKPTSKNSKRKAKKNRSSSNTNIVNGSSSPRIPASPREFAVSKAESELIVRHPRGPDGTKGFNSSTINSSSSR